MSERVVEASGLTKHYGAVVGLDSLDLTVERGEVLGLLGPNGAGKSTALRLFLDLVRPTRGAVTLFGRLPRDPRARARVGFLPGDLVLDPRLTGGGMLRFLGALTPGMAPWAAAERRGALCERLGLAARDLLRPVRGYSRGMRQKLGLVAALQHDPELLVLDEPTSALDPLVRETVFELLKEASREGRTVIHSSHVLSEVERTCSRVAILRDGKLVSLGGTEELRRAVVRRMAVRFAAPVRREELLVPGVEILEGEGGSFLLRVSGPIDPLLAVLARHPVVHLAFPEPSLEEAFVVHYRAPRGDS